MGYSFEIKPFRDHSNDAPISIYVIADDQPTMDKYSCGWCKRTIFDIKGGIDRVVSTPTSLNEFDIAVNIRCKLCHANYRLLINSSH